MTTDDIRSKRQLILLRLLGEAIDVPTALDEWALLEEQVKLPRPPFYAMIDDLDTQRAVLLASQGQEAQQLAIIDLIVSRLMDYAETVKNGVKA